MILCLTQCEKDAEPEALISDANFLAALLEMGVDIDYDGAISPAEAEAVTELYISSRGRIQLNTSGSPNVYFTTECSK